MARQAADAFLAAHPTTPTYLILNPATTQTCDAVPLPTVSLGNGHSSTVSIVGYGSNVSSIVKRPGCSPGAATLRHSDSLSGSVTSAWFQGFTVSANHIDLAACEMYGMSGATFFDLACGDASPGADHELELGNRDANSVGLMYNINLYNIKTYDTVGVGKGAQLAPVWSNGQLTGIVLVNAGTKKYTQQYTRALLIGPDLATCTTIPTLVPTVSDLSTTTYTNLPTVHYGYITGASITNPGQCSATARIYVLIQDGIPVSFGMKFSYVTSSHAWNLEPTGSTTYGEGWMAGSGNNVIMGEHPYTNQTVQIVEYAMADRHVNAFFDSPGAYGAAIFGQAGSFTNSVFSWDGASYVGSSGYYFGVSSYTKWAIQNSQCTNSTSEFNSVSTAQGPLAGSGPSPAGVTLSDIEACDGTTLLDWETEVTPLQN